MGNNTLQSRPGATCLRLHCPEEKALHSYALLLDPVSLRVSFYYAIARTLRRYAADRNVLNTARRGAA